MKNNDQTVWTKTNLPNLYRHRNRRYYTRVFIGGKENWSCLRTNGKVFYAVLPAMNKWP
jgi:hypothetical protein